MHLLQGNTGCGIKLAALGPLLHLLLPFCTSWRPRFISFCKFHFPYDLILCAKLGPTALC